MAATKQLNFLVFLLIEGCAKILPLGIINYLYLVFSNEDFVQYLMTEAIIFLFMAIMLLGQDSLLVRVSVNKPEKLGEVYACGVTLMLVVFLSFFVASMLVSVQLNWREILSTAFLLALVFFTNNLFIALKKNTHYLLITALQQIFSLAFTILIFHVYTPTISNRLFAMSLSLIVCFGVQMLLMINSPFRPNRVSREVMVRSIADGFPLFLHSLINIARQRADKLISATFLNPEVAARYGLISTYTMMISVFYSSAFKFYMVKFYEDLRDKPSGTLSLQRNLTFYNVLFLLVLMLLVLVAVTQFGLPDSFLIPASVGILSYVIFPLYLLRLNKAIYGEEFLSIIVAGFIGATGALTFFFLACLAAFYTETLLYMIPLIYCALANFCFRKVGVKLW